MNENDISLFTDFPPISTDTWEAQINADLKGKDYEKTLVWQTNDGIKVHPYYREESLKELDFTNSLPGYFPYVRGNRSKGNQWLVRQDIEVTDINQANKIALNILKKGVTSLGFVFNDSRELGPEDFKNLFQGIDLSKVEVNLEMKGKNGALVKSFVTFFNEQITLSENVKASVNYDPIGVFILRGKFCTGETETFARMKEVFEFSSGYSNLRMIAVNGRYFNNAGSSIVQELGYSLAIGAEYLNRLTDLGLDAGLIAPKIRFNFGVGGSYFMEIAKLRAARMLWANIVKAYNPKCDSSCEEEIVNDICLCACKMNIHAETSVWNKTIYDPYVNMLRTQTEAMSAVLGGTDSLNVLPFDIIYEKPTEFAERIARNQQALLKEEANFDKIADPAAGSYYIETLTASVAEQAWKLFLEIQDEGGFIAAFRKGTIQAQVKTTAEKRKRAIATRRENILGVNQFANVTEQITADMCPAIFHVQDQTAADAEVETIKIFRGAEQFEALRYSTDYYSGLNPRPKVFMLTIGDLTLRKARAQFSCNFFAVAGYEVIDNNGFITAAKGVEAALAAKADIVVICSSDDEYSVFAPEAYRLLKDKAIFVVAGAPACMDDLKAAGIENFISVKSNLLETLTDFNNKLGIKKAI
jgi:methylmalonyl-CoA mutase